MLPLHFGILPEEIKHCIQQSTTSTIYISLSLRYCNVRILEAVVRSCSVKKVFLKILQNSQVFSLAQELPVNITTS